MFYEDEFINEAEKLRQKQKDVLRALEELRLYGQLKPQKQLRIDTGVSNKSKPQSKPQKKKAIKTPQSAPPSEKKPSIARYRFEAELKRLKEQEEQEFLIKFKANPIPKSSLVQKYHLLAAQEQEKRRIKAQRRAETLARMRPRTHEKTEEERLQFEMFKAKPLPDYLKQMPKVTEKRKVATEEFSFKPNITRTIPNFKKLHEMLQSSKVERNKQNSVPKRSERRKTAEPTLKTTEWIEPRETKSFTLKKEFNKRLIEAINSPKEQEREEDIERRKKLEAKIKNALHLTIKKRETRDQEAFGEFRKGQMERDRQYREFLRELDEKLDERPCIFERQQIDAAKSRAIELFEQTLVKHGVQISSTQ